MEQQTDGTRIKDSNISPIISIRLHPEFLEIIECVREKLETVKEFNYRRATRTDAIQELLRMGIAKYVARHGDPRRPPAVKKKENKS